MRFALAALVIFSSQTFGLSALDTAGRFVPCITSFRHVAKPEKGITALADSSEFEAKARSILKIDSRTRLLPKFSTPVGAPLLVEGETPVREFLTKLATEAEENLKLGNHWPSPSSRRAAILAMVTLVVPVMSRPFITGQVWRGVTIGAAVTGTAFLGFFGKYFVDGVKNRIARVRFDRFIEKSLDWLAEDGVNGSEIFTSTVTVSSALLKAIEAGDEAGFRKAFEDMVSRRVVNPVTLRTVIIFGDDKETPSLVIHNDIIK